VSSSQHLGNGIIGIDPDAIDPPGVSHRFFSVYGDLTNVNALVVGERATNGNLVCGPFSILVIGPWAAARLRSPPAVVPPSGDAPGSAG